MLDLSLRLKPRSLSGSWTPKNISTMGWWDPSDTSTITEDLPGKVLQINDLSGNGYHLKQTAGASQPSNGATINLLNAISGDGTEWMGADGFDWHVSGNLDIFIIAAIRTINSPTNSLASYDETYLATPVKDWQFDAGVLAQFDGRLNQQNMCTTFSLSGGPYSDSTNRLWRITFDYDNSTIKIYANESLVGSTSDYTAKPNGEDDQSFKILSNRTGTAQVDANFGEIVVTQNLTKGDEISSYLRTKWGIT